MKDSEATLSVEPRRHMVGVREAAKVLSLHMKSIYRLIAQRKLPAYKIGGRIRIDLDEVRRAARLGGTNAKA